MTARWSALSVTKKKTACENGHYVCSECHTQGIDTIIGVCMSETSKNPIKILQKLMALPFCYMHGPEHHIMVGSALLTAYKNSGGVAECMQNGNTAESVEAQALVKELQNYITENYYTCTNEILAGLGQMYIADERFKNNIDKHAVGTAEFISKAIKVYCSK